MDQCVFLQSPRTLHYLNIAEPEMKIMQQQNHRKIPPRSSKNISLLLRLLLSAESCKGELRQRATSVGFWRGTTSYERVPWALISHFFTDRWPFFGPGSQFLYLPSFQHNLSSLLLLWSGKAVGIANHRGCFRPESGSHFRPDFAITVHVETLRGLCTLQIPGAWRDLPV